MRKIVIVFSIFTFITSSCGQKTKKQAVNETAAQFSVEDTVLNQIVAGNHTAEDTVRYQIGGKLFSLDISPSDSITVINTVYYQPKEGGLYREYHFIVHNRYSNAHFDFADTTLNTIYNSYMTKDWYREAYETYIKPGLDKIQSRLIDPAIKNFNGYWIYLKEHNGDYYLDDDWSWHSSFNIADSIFTNHYMDGPDPKKIVEAISIETGGISISFGGEPVRIELFDESRNIYRFIDGRQIHFIAPARAIHNFEIIQYTNNTGDLI